jgi:hypothetical protein
MSFNLEKELAFIDLAVEEGVYDKEFKNYLVQFAKNGATLAPTILEHIIEKRAGLKILLNEHHRDFEDNSDAKTSCATLYMCRKIFPVYKGCIGSAEKKLGYIRAVVYNGFTKKMDYFLIPPPDDNLCNYNYQGNIHYTYNKSSGKYSNNLELYRKKTLKEICTNLNLLKRVKELKKQNQESQHAYV